MNIPIRMIGLATTFVWIFLVVFLVSAVYSVRDSQFDLGKPQVSVTMENKLLVSLPINIVNNGYYDIGAFNLTTEILDADGFMIRRDSTFLRIISRGGKVTALHDVTLNFDDLLDSSEDYLFNDTDLTVAAFAGMRIAEFIPVQVSTNFSLPWGGPLYNFTLGEPERAGFNLTHFRVTVPMSFENHAFFDVIGNIQVQMYSSSDLLVGDNRTSIEAPQHSMYNGRVEFHVPITELTSRGRFNVYFQTSFFECGPLVIHYG